MAGQPPRMTTLSFDGLIEGAASRSFAYAAEMCSYGLLNSFVALLTDEKDDLIVGGERTVSARCGFITLGESFAGAVVKNSICDRLRYSLPLGIRCDR